MEYGRAQRLQGRGLSDRMQSIAMNEETAPNRVLAARTLVVLAQVCVALHLGAFAFWLVCFHPLAAADPSWYLGVFDRLAPPLGIFFPVTGVGSFVFGLAAAALLGRRSPGSFLPIVIALAV